MKRIILLALVAITVGFVAFALLSGNTTTVTNGTTDREEVDISQPAENEPLDVVSDFMNGWVNAQRAGASTTVEAYLANNPAITEAAAETILARAETRTDVEPFTCQATLPERIGSRIVFEDERQAEISVVARGIENNAKQAIVRVQRTPTDWEIFSHECIDLANPERPEFTFERTGRLAKDSVPAPYNNSVWHVLYLDGSRVGIVPLAFTAETQCESASGTTVCNPEEFTENTVVEIRGDLTETGAVVSSMTLQ